MIRTPILWAWLALSSATTAGAEGQGPPDAGSGPAAPAMMVVDGRARYGTAGHLELLSDPHGDLTLDQVRAPAQARRFAPAGPSTPNLGFDHQVYWARLQIDNRLTESATYYLDLGYPLLDSVRAYVVSRHGVTAYRAGDREPFGVRPVAARTFLFPLQLQPAQPVTVYLRVETVGSLDLPLDLLSRNAAFERLTVHSTMLALFYGALLMLVVSHLYHAWRLNDVSAAYYALFIACYIAFQLALTGIAFQFLWPNNPWWANVSLPVFLCAAYLSGVLFTRSILDTRANAPAVDRLLIGLSWVAVAGIGLALFGPYDIALRFSVTLVFTVALFILIGFRISLQGYRPARYYSMAWAVFLGGMIIYGLKAFGVLPTNFWTTWVTQFGSVWQAVILAFAITDRFYLHEEERRERQDRYTAGLLRYNDALNARVEESDEEVRAKNRRLQEQAETLRIAERKADAANRAKSEFLANMSHEIRTPMNAIIGFLHLLGNSRLNATQRGYVDKAERAARALMQLIHDLLDFSRIDVGRLELQSAPFDVGAVVRDAYDLVALGAGEKGLDLRLQQDGVDGCWVAGDAGRLQQVLVNLLHNAIKFTAAGEVCFEAASAPDVDGRVRLRFAISDTGIGIGADEQQRLFKPFTQADASITRRFGGTGLGLSISQQLVQQMGGTIDVESTPGVGSRFSFMLRLPAAAAESQRAPVCESRDVAPLTGMPVLVVEDQPLNQEVVAALLEESGVMPLLVASGQDAIARLRSGERVEAVLMDLQMPHMDGYETVRHIRAIPGCGDLPIIAMTAHASVAERQRCHAAGFAAHLAKPVDHQALCAVLRQVRAPMAAGATASGTDPARADRPASGVSASAPPEASEQPLAADALGPGLTAPEADRAGHVERLQRFADRFGEHPALIRGRLEAGDRAAAMSAAHALAGVALSLGIPQVGIAAKRLEQSADQDGATLRAAVAALEAAMGTALDSITRLVPAVADTGAANLEPLDQASLRQALQQLTTLLGARNLRARAELEMLLARTREPRLRRRLLPVADAVRRFDFAAAGEGVAALLAELDDADEPWD